MGKQISHIRASTFKVILIGWNRKLNLTEQDLIRININHALNNKMGHYM